MSLSHVDILLSGVLEKRGATFGKWVKRIYYIVFQSGTYRLCYKRKETDKDFVGEILLIDFDVLLYDDTTSSSSRTTFEGAKGNHAFMIETQDQVVVLRAPNVKERSRWVGQLSILRHRSALSDVAISDNTNASENKALDTVQSIGTGTTNPSNQGGSTQPRCNHCGVLTPPTIESYSCDLCRKLYCFRPQCINPNYFGMALCSTCQLSVTDTSDCGHPGLQSTTNPPAAPSSGTKASNGQYLDPTAAHLIGAAKTTPAPIDGLEAPSDSAISLDDPSLLAGDLNSDQILINVMKAQGLRSTGLFSNSFQCRPYCIIKVDKNTARTKTINISQQGDDQSAGDGSSATTTGNANNEAIWDFSCEFPIHRLTQNVTISIYHNDIFGSHTLLGKVAIPINHLEKRRIYEAWFQLTNAKGSERRGKVLVQLIRLGSGQLSPIDIATQRLHDTILQLELAATWQYVGHFISFDSPVLLALYYILFCLLVLHIPAEYVVALIPLLYLVIIMASLLDNVVLFLARRKADFIISYQRQHAAMRNQLAKDRTIIDNNAKEVGAIMDSYGRLVVNPLRLTVLQQQRGIIEEFQQQQQEQQYAQQAAESAKRGSNRNDQFTPHLTTIDPYDANPHRPGALNTLDDNFEYNIDQVLSHHDSNNHELGRSDSTFSPALINPSYNAHHANLSSTHYNPHHFPHTLHKVQSTNQSSFLPPHHQQQHQPNTAHHALYTDLRHSDLYYTDSTAPFSTSADLHNPNPPPDSHGHPLPQLPLPINPLTAQDSITMSNKSNQSHHHLPTTSQFAPTAHSGASPSLNSQSLQPPLQQPALPHHQPSTFDYVDFLSIVSGHIKLQLLQITDTVTQHFLSWLRSKLSDESWENLGLLVDFGKEWLHLVYPASHTPHRLPSDHRSSQHDPDTFHNQHHSNPSPAYPSDSSPPTPSHHHHHHHHHHHRDEVAELTKRKSHHTRSHSSSSVLQEHERDDQYNTTTNNNSSNKSRIFTFDQQTAHGSRNASVYMTSSTPSIVPADLLPAGATPSNRSTKNQSHHRRNPSDWSASLPTSRNSNRDLVQFDNPTHSTSVNPPLPNPLGNGPTLDTCSTCSSDVDAGGNSPRARDSGAESPQDSHASSPQTPDSFTSTGSQFSHTHPQFNNIPQSYQYQYRAPQRKKRTNPLVLNLLAELQQVSALAVNQDFTLKMPLPDGVLSLQDGFANTNSQPTSTLPPTATTATTTSTTAAPHSKKSDNKKVIFNNTPQTQFAQNDHDSPTDFPSQNQSAAQLSPTTTSTTTNNTAISPPTTTLTPVNEAEEGSDHLTSLPPALKCGEPAPLLNDQPSLSTAILRTLSRRPQLTLGLPSSPPTNSSLQPPAIVSPSSNPNPTNTQSSPRSTPDEPHNASKQDPSHLQQTHAHPADDPLSFRSPNHPLSPIAQGPVGLFEDSTESKSVPHSQTDGHRAAHESQAAIPPLESHHPHTVDPQQHQQQPTQAPSAFSPTREPIHPASPLHYQMSLYNHHDEFFAPQFDRTQAGQRYDTVVPMPSSKQHNSFVPPPSPNPHAITPAIDILNNNNRANQQPAATGSRDKPRQPTTLPTQSHPRTIPPPPHGPVTNDAPYQPLPSNILFSFNKHSQFIGGSVPHDYDPNHPSGSLPNKHHQASASSQATGFGAPLAARGNQPLDVFKYPSRKRFVTELYALVLILETISWLLFRPSQHHKLYLSEDDFAPQLAPQLLALKTTIFWLFLTIVLPTRLLIILYVTYLVIYRFISLRKRVTG